MLVDRKPTPVIFKKTNSAVKILGYLKTCIKSNLIIDINNLYPSTVDQALFLLQEEIKIPIITKTERMMRVLSLSNLKKVYTIDALPGNIIRAVCYWDLDPGQIPERIEVALTLLRNPDESNN
jgi:hypothetical protein